LPGTFKLEDKRTKPSLIKDDQRIEKRRYDTLEVADVDLIKKATREYDLQKVSEKQKTMFDRIMAYTSQNYNKDTNKFLPPINAYVGIPG